MAATWNKRELSTCWLSSAQMCRCLMCHNTQVTAGFGYSDTCHSWHKQTCRIHSSHFLTFHMIRNQHHWHLPLRCRLFSESLTCSAREVEGQTRFPQFTLELTQFHLHSHGTLAHGSIGRAGAKFEVRTQLQRCSWHCLFGLSGSSGEEEGQMVTDVR